MRKQLGPYKIQDGTSANTKKKDFIQMLQFNKSTVFMCPASGLRQASLLFNSSLKGVETISHLKYIDNILLRGAIGKYV